MYLCVRPVSHCPELLQIPYTHEWQGHRDSIRKIEVLQALKVPAYPSLSPFRYFSSFGQLIEVKG